MGVLAFSEFEADPELFELRRGGALIEISAKCFDILLYLIHHRERVVSKAELREKVWRTQALSARRTSRLRCITAGARPRTEYLTRLLIQ